MRRISFIVNANKLYNSYREKEELWRYTEAVVTISTIVLFIVLAIRPTVMAISSLVSEIKNREKLAEEMGTKINQIIAAQDTYARIQEHLSIIDEAYPENYNLAQGASQLVGLSADNGLSVKSISFSEIDLLGKSKQSSSEKNQANKTRNYDGVDFAISATGSYQSSIKFLQELGELRRLFIIDSYSLSSSKEIGSDIVNISISGFLTYYDKSNKR